MVMYWKKKIILHVKKSTRKINVRGVKNKKKHFIYEKFEA